MEVADDSTRSASTHSARSLSTFDDIPDEIIRRCIRLAVAEDPRYVERPLFLYFPGPLATLRAVLSSSKSFRRETLPLMIRLAWDGELNVGRRLLHSSQLFLQAPSFIHLTGMMIKCCVIRQSNPFFLLPSFELYEVDVLSTTFISDLDLRQARPPLLKANECSNGSYEISARGAGYPCTRLVTHSDGLSFTLTMIDQASSKMPQASESSGSSTELKAEYQTFENGKVVPRMITVKLMNRISSPSFCEPFLMADHNSEEASHHDGGLIQQCHEPGGTSIFINRAPYRSPTLHCWCLDFGGRVKLASVKNCQLHLHKDDPINHFQFGKIKEEGLTTIYTLDFDPRCMSALQAFAIALTTFKRKAFKGA
jgi:hypothetical protein